MRNAYPFSRRFLRLLLLTCCLGFSLLLGSARRAAAQTAPDTTRLHYSEEVVTNPLPDATLRVERADRHLWKLGLNNFLFNQALGSTGDYSRLGLHLAYEHQLGSPAWSVLGEVSPAISHFRADAGRDWERILSVRTQLAGRYYYNLERRRRLGRRTSGFSANYLSLALGAGLGRRAHETPFFLYLDSGGPLVSTDLALLYGLQRRLGRYGFIDANLGFASRLGTGSSDWFEPALSLRVGLLLGSAPPFSARPVPANADESLRPRLYVGAQAGFYGYRVRYSAEYPYPPDVVQSTPRETRIVHYGLYAGEYGEGYGAYSDNLGTTLPYLYAGYYLTPRLAVQLGVQRGGEVRDNSTYFSTPGVPDSAFSVANGRFERRHLALPVLLRFGLTPAFLRRWQLDALAGLVPVWSSAEFREYLLVSRHLTNQQTFGFRRTDFGLHGSLGFNIAYGFGRRRRVQLTGEAVLNKDLRTLFEDKGSWQGGLSAGLRYRFGYH